MKGGMIAILLIGATTLGACANRQDDAYVPGPPPAPGPLPGTVAAGRDGDGIGPRFYTADGVDPPAQHEKGWRQGFR